MKIRYRGYYYDTETGFYYLQSRYYDPTLCRFISPDKYTLLSTLSMSLGELNLYSYCANNPIMFTDETGESVVGGLIAIGLIFVTVLDIVWIASDVVKVEPTENGTIAIENSQSIVTPWVQWGYSFYLNHIRSDTKNIIKGTTSGVQGEWAAHNLAYYVLSLAKKGADIFGINNSDIVAYLGAASPANIGATVYNNPKGNIRTGLIVYNIYNSPVAALIDFWVYKAR